MAVGTIYHNPNCSSSVHAVRTAEELGLEMDVVPYLKQPPDEATLRAIVDKFDGDVTELVRRDNTWKALELGDDDVATAEQVVAVLAAHPKLLQRPLIVTADRAVIGRPKDEVADLLTALTR
jgi:arsenate reductase